MQGELHAMMSDRDSLRTKAGANPGCVAQKRQAATRPGKDHG